MIFFYLSLSILATGALIPVLRRGTEWDIEAKRNAWRAEIDIGPALQERWLKGKHQCLTGAHT